MRSLEDARWLPFNGLRISDLPSNGESPAAYAMRDANTKEIMYIGGTSSLLKRLFGNYLGGFGGSTTQRIHSNLFDGGFISTIEVAWLPTGEYKRKEKDLTSEYRSTHVGKLPPWNKR